MQYGVFMIDPPWPKKKGGLRKARPNQGRQLDYATLSVSEITDLLVQKVLCNAAEDHCCFVWVVDQFLFDAEDQFQQLGYKRHARLVWDKENGVAPAFTVRYSHEYLLWFYKKRLPPVAPEVRGRFQTVLREKARQHSRKPEAAYKMVSALYPTHSKIDVFSREKREGWDQFGDQPDYFISAD